MTLRFVTTNNGKLREVSQMLRRPLLGVGLELEEIQTTDIERLVWHKTMQAYRKLRVPLIVEDTSLIFKQWGALPGPFIKYFLENLGLKGMVDALAPFENWIAAAICGVGYHDGARVHYFEGRVEGIIVFPTGEGGFGWDAIFRPDGSSATYAEMSAGQKNTCSHRAVAMKALEAHLETPQRDFTRAPAHRPRPIPSGEDRFGRE